MSKLCEKCLAFQDWDIPLVQKWSGALFAHHATGYALIEAANSGCNLCSLLQHVLSRDAKHPENETEIPDRQIWLECKEPDGNNMNTRLNVIVEPESLASAGCREMKHSEKAIFILSNMEFDDKVKDIMKGNAFGLSFFALGTKEGTRLFYGLTEIYDDDLFWALANPFWEARVNFVNIPGGFGVLLTAFVNVSLTGKAENTRKILAACNEFEDNDTGSKASFTLISGWLKECLENHPQCRISDDKDMLLPTRVIDIGGQPDDKGPRLVLTQPDQRGRYAALSHRWGDTKPLLTTTNTLFTRQEGISESEMSQTFIDAMRVCKELNIQYIWIDSLCIIQDDAEDWNREASLMASVYRNAYITIAAVDTEDEKAGLFSKRNGLQNRPCKFDLELPPRSHLRKEDLHLAVNEKKYGDIFRLRGPLDGRGWVLQEQLLSRRIVNFKKEGVYWECLTTECSEWAPEGSTQMIGETFMKDGDYITTFKKGVAALLDLDDPDVREKFYRSWMLIVQEYSRRSLTKETDKMAAIYGIIKEISRCTDDDFLMGVWGKYFWRGLMWCVFGPGCPDTQNLVGYSGRLGPVGERHEEFRAASWSWLGIKGTIRYAESYLDEAKMGDLMSECELSMEQPSSQQQGSEINYFGRFNAKLKLTGPVRRAVPVSIDDKERKLQAAGSIRNEQFVSALVPTSKENLAPRNAQLVDIQPNTWRTAHQWFRLLSQTETAFTKITDEDNEATVTISTSALEDELFQESMIVGPKYHADFYDDMREDIDKASLQYTLFVIDEGAKFVGVWAPDVADEFPAVRGEEFLPGYEGPKTSTFTQIHFIGIDRREGFVRALGIVPVRGVEGYFMRVGMGWWLESEWDSGEAEVMECIII